MSRVNAGPVEPMSAEIPLTDPPVSVQLADGTGMTLRPVTCRDREYFRMGFRSLSSESRYHRFFSHVPVLTDAQLHYFTEVDQINHVAWMAVPQEPAPVSGLGVARFVRLPEQPNIAEFSFTVVDPIQRKGLGRFLLAMLYLQAAERGVEILRAFCLCENETVVSWLCRLGAEPKGYSEGTIELDLRVKERPNFSAPCGSAAERFGEAQSLLGRQLATARER